MQKNIKKSVTTISGNKITDLLLSPAKHRPDDSAVFQPHKSREDSKINSNEWVECKKILKKSVTTISGSKITDLLLSPAKHRLDDSAVFQPHKSREDSKINFSMQRVSGMQITDLLLSPAKHRQWKNQTHNDPKLTRTSEWNAEKYKKICNAHLRQ